MGLNLEPVKVSIEIETTSLARDAFYNICFITNNEKAPRTLKVERLKDLLDNGYDRSSLAYNFCVGVFAQQGIPSVYVRAKRAVESYSDAFSADDNSNFYFVVIESKELYEISDFNQYLSSVDENKLQFYSSISQDLSEVEGGKLVNYYQEVFDFSEEDNYYLNKSYKIVTSHNYSSKPYPALVEKQDGYIPETRPLDVTVWQILKDYSIDTDAFKPFVNPLDVTIRNLLQSRYLDFGVLDTYTPSVSPLDVTVKSLLESKTIDNRETYIQSVSPLDVTVKEVLIVQKVNEESAYIPKVVPNNITIKRGIE